MFWIIQKYSIKQFQPFVTLFRRTVLDYISFPYTITVLPQNRQYIRDVNVLYNSFTENFYTILSQNSFHHFSTDLSNSRFCHVYSKRFFVYNVRNFVVYLFVYNFAVHINIYQVLNCFIQCKASLHFFKMFNGKMK